MTFSTPDENQTVTADHVILTLPFAVLRTTPEAGFDHCSQDFQGYMEGGAAEGARAGAEVLAALKK